MCRIRMVIEVYGGVAQNIYVAHEAPETLVDAVIVDWDHEHYDSPDNCLVHATGPDGEPMLACLLPAALKPWRLLPAAGIQELLDRAGLADFGSPSAPEPQAGWPRAAARAGFICRRSGRAT